MIVFPTNEAKTSQQSLLAVYFQALLYYDEILTYFLLVIQYFFFIYKYNVLTYSSSTIAGEIILLTILVFLNPLRLSFGRTGNKGRLGLRLIFFLLLGVLYILGMIYVAMLQVNALYVEMILSVVALIFVGMGWVLGLVITIYYKCSE